MTGEDPDRPPLRRRDEPDALQPHALEDPEPTDDRDYDDDPGVLPPGLPREDERPPRSRDPEE